MKDHRIHLGLLLALTLVGCGRNHDADPSAATAASEPPPLTTQAPAGTTADLAANDVKVSDVDIGRSIKQDNTIDDKTQSFKPVDTIYVSVKTKGTAPAAKLETVVTFEDGQLVKKFEETLAQDGEEITEFHLSKPDGWAAGKYKVETLIDGESQDTQDFKVGA